MTEIPDEIIIIPFVSLDMFLEACTFDLKIQIKSLLMDNIIHD